MNPKLNPTLRDAVSAFNQTFRYDFQHPEPQTLRTMADLADLRGRGDIARRLREGLAERERIAEARLAML